MNTLLCIYIALCCFQLQSQELDYISSYPQGWNVKYLVGGQESHEHWYCEQLKLSGQIFSSLKDKEYLNKILWGSGIGLSLGGFLDFTLNGNDGVTDLILFSSGIILTSLGQNFFNQRSKERNRLEMYHNSLLFTDSNQVYIDYYDRPWKTTFRLNGQKFKYRDIKSLLLEDNDLLNAYKKHSKLRTWSTTSSIVNSGIGLYLFVRLLETDSEIFNSTDRALTYIVLGTASFQFYIDTKKVKSRRRLIDSINLKLLNK